MIMLTLEGIVTVEFVTIIDVMIVASGGITITVELPWNSIEEGVGARSGASGERGGGIGENVGLGIGDRLGEGAGTDN